MKNNNKGKKRNIFLTGFSGSGKTSVGLEVVQLLGWRSVDLDQKIAGFAGKPIETIFVEDGESHFRQLERERLEEVSRGEGQVVATGGGIVMDGSNRRLMDENGVIICLEARPDTVLRRLELEREMEPNPTVRPMLIDPDPIGRIVALKTQRQFFYSLADWIVQTDCLTPRQVADEVVRAYNMLTEDREAEWMGQVDDLAAMVRTSSGDYPVWVGWGLLDGLGGRVKSIMSPGAAYVITDEGARLYARRAQISLEASGVATHLFVLPPGEQHKNLETMEHIYGWLAEKKSERGHLVLAVGGGVVGDMAGFAAATFMRGMLFAQVPTTLLAMVDAAVGGKTAVDLPQGKNLVGAFYQPRFVAEDVQTLQTLPERELTCGWAEVIKHGLILDEGLLRTFEERRCPIRALDRSASSDVIRRSVAIKADVVSRDEKETLGIRAFLNYGHTIGHAIEAASGYGSFLHGEAVGIGMMGAAKIANGLGMLSASEVERQRAVLEGFGLPVTCEGVDMTAVREAMTVDKKTVGGVIRWVLLDGIGRAVVRSDVPTDLVKQVLGELAQDQGTCQEIATLGGVGTDL